MLYQSDTINSPITAIDTASSTVTVQDSKTWSIAAVTTYKGISTSITWVNQACGNAGMDKHFKECALLFKEQSFISAYASFYTEVSGGYERSTIYGTYGTGAWGSSAWGDDLWGGVSRPKPLRVFIPRNKSRGSIINVRFQLCQAYANFSLQGASLIWSPVSERLNRN